MQINNEGFSNSVINFKLDEGIYTLSLLFLTDYDTVSDFFENTGFGELNPRDIDWINESFNRDNVDYSVEYYMVVR